jgi:hypothetical protein
MTNERFNRIQNISIATLGIGLFLSLIFSCIAFIYGVRYDIHIIWALPYFIIMLAAFIISLLPERKQWYNKEDQYNEIAKENKKLKKIIQAQAKMRNINVL